MNQKNNLSETAYQYGCVGMEEVFNNINEYIIPENQNVCRLLWAKNIFTKMCNNYDNDNSNGLGLYIVKQLLLILHIRYEFVPTKLGDGMKFVIYL